MTQISFNDEIIILAVRNWQTADKYAVGFSKEHGKLVFLAFGARYPKSTMGRLVQPFATLQAEFYSGSRLEKLKSCSLITPPPKLDVQQLAYIFLAAEVTEKLTEPGDPRQELYALWQETLPILLQHNPRLVVLSFLLKLLALAGLAPVIDSCVICGRDPGDSGSFSNEQGGVICDECRHQPENQPLHEETRQLWQQLLTLDFRNPETFAVKGGALMELEKIIHGFIVYQTEQPLKSLAFLAQL